MFQKCDGGTAVNPQVMPGLRCPNCRQRGTFESTGVQDLHSSARMFGQRRCPDPSCRTLIFFVTLQGKLVATYPPLLIDFDSSNVPADIVEALTEALTCHAHGCHIAAAVMVRKTLELLCADRGAEGKNLKARIKALAGEVVLPTALVDGLDNLRLLGNDAAHVESEVYKDIGTDEVELAVEVTKEVLKGVYQYASLVDRLAGLKKEEAPA